MRASLPDTLRERRRTRAEHPRRTPPAPMPAAPASPRAADPAVERVRSAGGPLDEAAYVCECGFSFRAPVSTTVACPHCHTQQAW
ncbi:MAG TPA: hypothetical protein VG188_07975 [Solirubrobacteraceae bacterium]|nr:hypothetical protein [Solirubrobacteraceae bacterium]